MKSFIQSKYLIGTKVSALSHDSRATHNFLEWWPGVVVDHCHQGIEIEVLDKS